MKQPYLEQAQDWLTDWVGDYDNSPYWNTRADALADELQDARKAQRKADVAALRAMAKTFKHGLRDDYEFAADALEALPL